MVGTWALVLVMLASLWPLSAAQAQYPARAAADGWAQAQSGRVAVRLVAAPVAMGDLAEIRAALDVKLAPGWKTYWRAPGDAGLPPAFEWKGSANFADATIDYPPPRRHSVLGVDTIGYEDRVVFPLRIKPAQPGAAMNLDVRAHLLVCADICVPEKFDLTLGLPAGAAVPSPDANLVARAFSSVPGDGRAVGLRLESLEAKGIFIRAVVAADPPLNAPDLFVESPGGEAFAKPVLAPLDGGRMEMRLNVTDVVIDKLDLAGAALRVTLVDGDRSADFSAVAAPLADLPRLASNGPAASAASNGPAALAASNQFLAMIGAALLGGLILNVMPCVLPVLSLKLLAAAQYGGAERSRARAGFLASSAGILVSFLALAAAAAGLKAAGAAVGWGVQFQQPWFLALMIAVTALFAANLFGLFEIVLPRFVADRFDGGGDSGLSGAFATGAFATLLATPCSAPFLGTAVGFALAAGTMEIFVIFAALGVGMAAPYLAAAAFPGFATALPKPGRWMLTVRRALGVALLGTAVWLGTVLAAQIGWTRAETAPTSGVRWAAFDESAITAAVASGKIVFVDVTAEWCVTCKANKRLVLDRGAAAAALAGPNILALRADWTRPDEAISRFLARYGRYGVPFNIVYGPKAPQGSPLPEILTESAVLAALAEAGL